MRQDRVINTMRLGQGIITQFLAGTGDYIHLQNVHTSSEATSFIFNGHNENTPPGALQLGCKVDQSLPSSVLILECSYVSTPSRAFMATTGKILASLFVHDFFWPNTTNCATCPYTHPSQPRQCHTTHNVNFPRTSWGSR
jgi:hypothetical protein